MAKFKHGDWAFELTPDEINLVRLSKVNPSDYTGYNYDESASLGHFELVTDGGSFYSYDGKYGNVEWYLPTLFKVTKTNEQRLKMLFGKDKVPSIKHIVGGNNDNL